MIIALVSLVILVPIIYFLPLGLKVGGKIILIVLSFCIANIGILAKNNFPLWQSVLLVLLLLILVSYILDKRLGKALYLANDQEIEEEIGNTAPKAVKLSSRLSESSVDDSKAILKMEELSNLSSPPDKQENLKPANDDIYLEEIVFEDEKDSEQNDQSNEEKHNKPMEAETESNEEVLQEEELSELMERSEPKELNDEDGQKEVPSDDNEVHYMAEIEKLIEEDEEFDNLVLEDSNPKGQDDQLETKAEIKITELELTDLEDSYNPVDESLYEELFNEEKVEVEDSIHGETVTEASNLEIDDELPEIKPQEEAEFTANWDEDEIIPIDEIHSNKEEISENEINQADFIADNSLDLDKLKNEEMDVFSGDVDLNESPLELNEVAVGLESIQEKIEAEEILNQSVDFDESYVNELSEEKTDIPQKEEPILEHPKRNSVQQQIFHTMVSQINLMRKQLDPNQFEKLIQDHLIPTLPPEEHFTFASMLIEHYMRTHEMDKLKGLLDNLKNQYQDYPIVQLEILYLYGQYYENTL